MFDFFGARERLWLIGPIALLMFWLYAFAVTRTGIARYVFGIPFQAMNVLFNATAGTLIFWELPKWGRGEWFFTDRLKRHKAGEDETLAYVAGEICYEMNKHDPGHC